MGVSGDAAVPYGALFDALGRTLSNERAVLLLYALLHGSSRFHEYCLVGGGCMDIACMREHCMGVLVAVHAAAWKRRRNSIA